MAQPLYIAAFPREDGTMAVAWQRPRRRDNRLGTAEYGESDIFPADDGLGDSTATPPAKRGRAGAKDGAEHDGALPPLVGA